MLEADAAQRIRTRLKVRQMFLLVALQDSGNLNLAAAANRMSQPAASKMLKDIEDLFGVPLFERLPRGMRPTLYGSTLIRHVRLALDNLLQGQEALTTLRSGLAGQAHIGCIVTPSMTLVPQAIARAKALAPSLTVGVTVSTSDDLVAQLKAGRLDFLVARILEQGDESSLLYEDLSEETECAVARVGHPFVKRHDLGLVDLAQARWILSPGGTILRHRFEMMFRRADLPTPTDVVETTAMTIVLGLLQQSDYLHVMPTEVARCLVDAGELALLSVELPCHMDSFGLIMRRDHLLSPGAALLLAHVRQVAAEHYLSHSGTSAGGQPG